MDKETLSNYGWIVICVMVLAVMIALAGPFGNFVSEAVQSTTKGLFDVNKNALDNTGLMGEIPGQEFEDTSNSNGSDGTETEKTTLLKFNQPYGIGDDSMTISYVFSEDGSYEIYTNGSLAVSIPAGTAVYTSNTIKFTGDPLAGDVVASISNDGTQIIVNSDITLVLGVGCIHKTIEKGICTECGANFRIEYTLTPSDYQTKTGIDISSGDVIIPELFQDIDGNWYTVSRIGTQAFFYHYRSLVSITLPDSVTTIMSAAFFECTSLESITIPASVTTIGQQAFTNCYSLTTINYGGTIEQWNNITFEVVPNGTPIWNGNCGDIIVQCTDGNITIPSPQE